MIDLMQEKTADWQAIFASSTTEQNIDNVAHTIVCDRNVSDAYIEDLKSWLRLLVESSE